MISVPSHNNRREIMPIETKIVDDFTYASYKFNRLNRPDISPEKWATIFRDGATLEKWFNKEQLLLRRE
jgi:hypothetical protein